MKDYYFFVKRFFLHPKITGSLLPSSKKLAERMTKQALNQKSLSLRYLEVGPGSGALTKYLIPKLRNGDTLDIVEIDPQFCFQLRKKYGNLPQVKIHEASILDFEEEQYDVVVSSLPLNAFSAGMVNQILLKYKKLAKPGGYVSYFEYMVLGRLKELYLKGKQQDDFRTILSLKKNFVKNYCTEVDKIWRNFPPARVFHCQM